MNVFIQSLLTHKLIVFARNVYLISLRNLFNEIFVLPMYNYCIGHIHLTSLNFDDEYLFG